ncbi:cytochrome P450 [Streptomyces sp. MS19]|uniref:cytochrome P450 n=1 Tax=Streptomyces sp. MS19 TaxID=3385972 RepID=UPI0039A1C543
MDDDRRMTRRPEDWDGCPVTRGPDGVWHVRGLPEARALLRSGDTVQAGLGVETVEMLPKRVRRPVLYRDGPEHREQRRQTARYFTPRRVDGQYRDVATRVADAQLAKLRASGSADLSELAFHLSIGVTCAVIGLTHSRPGIRRRLESFFPERFGTPGLTTPRGLYWTVRQGVNWLRIYVSDVRPAVRARRRAGADDLITHLVGQGRTTAEILGECLTFAAAGMITTREFVNAAAWHLFSDDALRARYRAADEPERLALLHEILRLEPVVNLLRRRTTAPVALPGATVPAGAVVEVHVDHANTDPRAVGDAPTGLCPARPLAHGAEPYALSFGDGAHKCPGAPIAILETDVFLTRLLALPGVRMTSPPTVRPLDAIGGYELRGLTVAVAP